ncbi:DUF169 domain-containing protein [Sedimentibacter sp. zth1]|uniref:DUF169 domain-containing protein n=1 Tax=Sedimentibacter sp. zth1 TaxID=2816908 RepID=UPI001A91D9D8|nr:DUF169 domain-containing protein [Sedimentibacter sp. zth1]QSX05865.1 DUF169 domain-containing protein [Sedimentibacter sp. zth1]
MKNKNVMRATLALNLMRNIIGIKFIDFKEDFDIIDVALPQKKGPLCYHARQAMDGNLFKATEDYVTCDYARYAIGLSKPDNTIVEGRSYKYCGLYESNSISKNIVTSMKYINQDIYGMVMGPLNLMDDADVVIIADYAETVMRIMQGYAYKFGNPEQLSFFGNQAMCADLISKPFSNNDINISLMCKGTRANGQFDKGEIGVAVPIGMFDSLVDGIVNTVNPVTYANEKRQILSKLDCEDDLGIKIDVDYNYGLGLKAYDSKVQKFKNLNNI